MVKGRASLKRIESPQAMMPEGAIPKEMPPLSYPEKREADGSVTRWTKFESGGKSFLSAPDGRRVISTPEIEAAEEKIQKIVARIREPYEKMATVLSAGDPYFEDLLKAREEDTLAFSALMQHVYGVPDTDALHAGFPEGLNPIGRDLEIDYARLAESVNTAAEQYFAGQYLMDTVEKETKKTQKPLKARARLGTIMRSVHGILKHEQQPSAQDERELAEAEADVTLSTEKKVVNALFHGAVEPVRERNREKRIVELGKQLQEDLMEAKIALQEKGQEYSVERIQAMETRLLEDFNDLMVMRGEEAITDWRLLPTEWIAFLAQAQGAKMEQGVNENPAMPERKPTELPEISDVDAMPLPQQVMTDSGEKLAMPPAASERSSRLKPSSKASQKKSNEKRRIADLKREMNAPQVSVAAPEAPAPVLEINREPATPVPAPSAEVAPPKPKVKLKTRVPREYVSGGNEPLLTKAQQQEIDKRKVAERKQEVFGVVPENLPVAPVAESAPVPAVEMVPVAAPAAEVAAAVPPSEEVTEEMSPGEKEFFKEDAEWQKLYGKPVTKPTAEAIAERKKNDAVPLPAPVREFTPETPKPNVFKRLKNWLWNQEDNAF